MIINQDIGTSQSSNALYYGFGYGRAYLSGGTTPPISTGGGPQIQTLGVVHQMGIDTMMDTSTGLV